MIVNVNMSREVFNYFNGHDLSQVVNALLEMYDFTNLPQRTGPREIERKVNVTNDTYISLYKSLGPRSKKLSLGRLLEFGYNMDVLSHSRFESMTLTVVEDDPTLSLVDKAYRALLSAQKYNENDTALKKIIEAMYAYREVVRCQEES